MSCFQILEDTTSRGYFLNNLEDFDCSFFGISPKEAILMDPQQRISLEVTWEALEDAGIPPQSLAGSNTAVYMGVNSDDYSKLLLEDLPGVEAWMGIGTAYCGVPNRISYLLDLRGPSTAVDAACASSLVAIHHGRQSLLTNETNVAIVGGVNALCGPGLTRVLDKAGAISKDGTCRSFDNDANGYGRGEGASVIILKRMSDALRDHDRILGILKGSAVGQDGRTNGIMAPNGQAQEAVARTALAGMDPATIQYVEAHATSTSVGDPVEITAMSHVYGANRQGVDSCYIGSVKPNVGHLEAGAGAVGFIKTVLAINKGVIPPQANLKKLNEKIDWANAGIQVPFAATPWPVVDHPRRAAICSYGYGGSVSHAVIEAYQKTPDFADRDFETDGPKVLLLSAPQEKRLPGYAKALREWMVENDGHFSVSSIAATLATRRGHHDYRAGFVVSSHNEALECAEKFLSGKSSTDITTGRVLGKDEQKNGAVWLFSGHGAQWPEMGAELLAKDPLFRETIEDLEPVIKLETGFSAIKALQNGDFETSDKVQVLTYAMQIGLATLLRANGAQPSAVIGHSVGEIAASVIAGALTPYEGALIVCRRSVLYRQVMGKGAMVLVNIPFKEISETLAGRSDICACIDSSPSSCVVSGSISAINEWIDVWEGNGIKVLKVNSDVSFHSPLLNCLATPLYLSLLKDISPRTPFVPLYSTAVEDSRQQILRDAGYWVRNMLKPVLLTGAVKAAAQDGYRIFLEVSTHPVIAHSVNETMMEMDIEEYAIIPTLLRNKPTRKALLKSQVAMWSKGIQINWKQLFADIDWADGVPKTQWKHQAFWKDVGTGRTDTSSLVHDVKCHTLLGQCTPVAGEDTTIFTTKLDGDTKPFPGNHPLHGTEIVPAAVLFNTFFHASGARSLANVNLRVPVAISAPRDLQVILKGGKVRLMSRLIHDSDEKEIDRSGSWLTHTTADITPELITDFPAYGNDIDILSIQSRIGTSLKNDFSIEYLAGVGVPAMGFPWKVTNHVGNTKEMLALVDMSPETLTDAAVPWNPTSWAPVFDAATSIGSTIFYQTPRLRMPAKVANIAIRDGMDPPKVAFIYVQEASTSDSSLAVDVTITNEAGEALAKFSTMRFSEIEGTPGGSKEGADGLVHQIAWPAARLSAEPSALSHVVLVGNENNLLIEAYINQLTRRHIKTTYVSSPESLSIESNSNGIAIFYIPSRIESILEVANAANTSCKDLLDIVKYVAANAVNARVFAVTDEAIKGASPTSLAHASLIGLGRIIAAEQPSIWGALIDIDSDAFPFHVVKYMSGADVVRVEDSIPRVARLRAMPQEKLRPATEGLRLQPRSDGTYVISGGLGSLGLEVASFLVERGARRIILISRRDLPSRNMWASTTGTMLDVIQKIQSLEKVGATIHCVAVDLSAADASTLLSQKLEMLSFPPVAGVVHAAGVVDDELVLSTTTSAFNRVLAPKVSGSLTLHNMFPPKSVDFFVMFSSCGQLFGFPGQASYASGNSFLDSLAEHRCSLGDNALALQWTSWRGLGMAASSQASADFIEAELDSKGITSISRDEAFRAWDHVAKYNISHGVVLRTRLLQPQEVLPMDILEEIAVRVQPTSKEITGNGEATETSTPAQGKDAIPTLGPERTAYLTDKISACVAVVLQLPDVSDVDPRVALPELGMDSVMTVALRKQLQTSLGVKVPPTLVWGHPTVSHLAKWFSDKL